MRERNRDRTRESRRSSMAPSTNGFPKRRHRTIVLRDSYEDRTVELRKAPSKRGRNGDRDKDSSNRSKRRRGSLSYRDEGEQSTEESVGNEQDDDVQYAGVSRIRSPNTTSSVSDQNHRRILMPAKPPPFKFTEEMIGVAVPRKARSASVKRSHENLVSASGGVGGGEEQNFRQLSNSPGGRSVEPVLPSFNDSARKKKKAIGAVPQTLKSSSSEIEIEIAELLFGLRTSKNHESSSQKLETSIEHHTSSTDAGKKKVEDCNYSTLLTNYSNEELVRIQHELPADVDCHDGNATYHQNGVSEVPKEDIGENRVTSGAGFGGTSADGRVVSSSGELQSCSKFDADKHDSASTRVMSAVLEASTQRAGKFEIDLMAPPPMMLSPKGDDLSRGDFISKRIPLALDMEMKREDNIKIETKEERPVKVEKNPEPIEKAKMEKQDRNKEEPTTSSNPKVEKIAHSSSVPLSTDVSSRPSTVSPIGSITMISRCTPPLLTVAKPDKTTGSSTTPQHVNFVLSQPQRKRCATHCYIARNILHQQATKMSPLLPATIGSGSLCGTKPINVNRVPAAENMVVSKQSQKHLPFVDQNGAQKKGLAATCDLSLTATRSSNNANPLDSTHRMQLQQGPHPGSTGNLVHGPAFLFPQAQHQASIVAATSQAGSVNSPSNPNLRSQSSVSGSLCTSSTLPAAATAVNFSYPNFAANDSPYMTVVHNNGYSFPFSTSSLGATAAMKGASPAQATNMLNGPFYSSQIFHPLQHQRQQQHPHSQAPVQPSYLNANTLSSSSSHKQSQGAQFSGNSILTSTTTEQQSQKRQTPQSHPHKHDIEIGGENVPSIANSTSHSQKNLHKQHLTIPVQPVNFSFKPPATSDIVGGSSGKFGDKQQQQQALKGGVDIIPSQAFAISYAGFNGTNIPSNLNFSSMAQNPVIHQSLPGIAWQGSQAASVPHTTQQKTCSITGEKSGGNSSHQDDEKKTTHCKSSTSGPTTLVFDNSSKNINFMLSASNGNWPSHSIASTVITSMPFYSNASSSQQSSQLLQLQKQHGMYQQQPAMATRSKSSSTNVTSATKFANNDPVFSQSLAQCKSSNQASHSKTTGRNTGSHVDHTSIITSKTPTIKSFSQEKGRVSQGHMQISFGGNYITSLPPQGQQPLNNNQPLCTTDAGTPFNGGNLKPNSEGRKVGSSVNSSHLQQSENSSGGSGQKSSPVCGRNVPSILSSGPGHLSELKY